MTEKVIETPVVDDAPPKSKLTSKQKFTVLGTIAIAAVTVGLVINDKLKNRSSKSVVDDLVEDPTA